jgi:hypothetical protein
MPGAQYHVARLMRWISKATDFKTAVNLVIPTRYQFNMISRKS